ncbi:MAG TPA: hypothetical protein VMW52_02280 [Phycisphaerae bacterium]|nr:hypothetical protein [Phycisphaerae bacterium]
MMREKKSWNLPISLCRAFEEWAAKTRITAQDAVAASIVYLMELPGDQRDQLFEALDLWLQQAAGGAVSSRRAGGSGAGRKRGGDADAERIGRGAAQAVKDAEDAERGRRGRTG